MEPGTIVGNRFTIEALSARGGMGAVYRAHDRSSGETVALKTMHATLSDVEAERLVREGSMLAALTHPGIVRHVAHGIDLSAGVYVAMEWIDGVTLRQRLATEGLTVRESVDVVRRIAEALGYAHRAGLIHRDIKPSNVILRGGELARPVLIDFGVARAGGVSELTQTGMMLGTPHFMAPEQARGSRDVDARADVFALGGLLFYCLTGRHVFEGESLMALLAKVLLEDAPDVRALVPTIPDGVAEVVARMLAKIPSERPADGVVAAEALAEVRFGDTERAPDVRAKPTGGHEMLTGTERRLVSVIVAKVPPRKSASEEETQVVAASPENRAELVQVLSGLGARAEVLADGTFLAAVSGFGSAIDQAAIAARCALRMRRELGGMAMALVTGRAVLDPSSTGGLGTKSGRGTDVFERAAALLSRECTDRVAIDDVTSGLLDGRFDVTPGAGGLVLSGEREVVAPTRTFLGRSMACVGRDRELAVLRAVWDEVAGDSVARVVLVTAPAGVGKSRLRWEFLHGLETAGAPHSVLFARGDAVTTTAPYALLGQALRHAAGVTDGSPNPFARLRARVARTVTKDITEVAELLGEVAQAPNPEPSMRLRAARNDPALMAERIAWAFESFVVAESASQPLLTVFEDLHWGDALTVALVDRVLERRPDVPWLVVALARPEVQTAFPRLWAERAVQPVPLSALSKKAAERLVREALGPQVPPEAVDRIVQQGAGNALYLEELVRAESEGRGSSSSLLAMVQSRLEALDVEERRVLRAASIFGQTAWTGGVVALLQQGSAGAIDDVLRSLEKRELVARRGDGRFPNTTEFIFRHALVRDAAYEMLTPDDAKLGHRLAGEWLEGAGERDAFVLANHYERGGIHDRAVTWFQRAAERALGANAFADVLKVCDRALALDPMPDVRGALLTLRAEACRWAGDTTMASDDATVALTLLPPGSKEWLMAIRTSGHASSFGGLRGRLPSLASQLLDVPIRDEVAGEYVIAATQVASGAIVSGMRDLGFRILERVASFDPKTFEDDPGVMARLHSCAGLRAYDRGDYEWLLTEQIAMVNCHARAGDDRSSLTQRVNVAFALMMMGAFEEAIEGLRQTEAECLRLGLWATALTARQNIGFALYSIGRLDEAEPIEQEVVASAESRSAPRLATLARRCLALIACLRGDAAKAIEYAKFAVDNSPDGPVRMASLAVLADALVLAGRVEEARAPAVEALRQLDAGKGAAFVGDLAVRAAHVAMLEAAGEKEAAATALRIAQAILDERAEKMSPARRKTYLERVPEAMRIRALALRLTSAPTA